MSAAPERKTAFTDQQYAEAYPVGIERHFWNVARNGIVTDTIEWIEGQRGARIGRMLEIGCGRGIVVEHLRRSGRDCFGVELAPVTIRDDLKDHVWSGTDCLTLPVDFRRQIELILLLDVIEHIENAPDFLARLREAYPNCAWLIISVPARMELWSSFDEHYGHFRRYDDGMLRGELERAGAELVRWRYRFIALYAVIYTLMRTGLNRPLENRTPGSTLLHRFAGAMLRRETWVCPRWLYGTSIFGVARFPTP